LPYDVGGGTRRSLPVGGSVKKEFFKLGVQEGAKALPKAQLKKEIKAIFQYQQLAWFTKPEVLAWRLEALEELLVA
jgi:hypothetical protein